MRNHGTIGALLKAAFAKVTVSEPDRKARDSIEELCQTATARMDRNAESFEEVMRRVVGDVGR